MSDFGYVFFGKLSSDMQLVKKTLKDILQRSITLSDQQNQLDQELVNLGNTISANATDQTAAIQAASDAITRLQEKVASGTSTPEDLTNEINSVQNAVQILGSNNDALVATAQKFTSVSTTTPPVTTAN